MFLYDVQTDTGAYGEDQINTRVVISNTRLVTPLCIASAMRFKFLQPYEHVDALII
jgi:hypothetical protein